MRTIYKLDWVDGIVCALVALTTFVVLMSTMGMGVPRDESFYYHAATQYAGWYDAMAANWDAGRFLESFTQPVVDRHMSYNAEHPALTKLLFGLSWKYLAKEWGWLPEIVALRVPAVVFASTLCGVLYLWSRQLFGRVAGVIAPVLLMLQPRFFWHAHLACFDVPVVACWVSVAYLYWRSLDDARFGPLLGIAWGIALSVKLNAFFLPLVLGLHWLVVAALNWRAGTKPKFPWLFAWMGVIGPVLFLALWPRHWFETVDRITWYLNFHLKHVHYMVYYFGENIQQPPLPISYPWVMTMLTVPATILLAVFAGATLYGARARDSARTDGRDRRYTGLLLAINCLFPIALISMPNTPIFGGTKHWAPAMPFFSMLAAAAIVWTGAALGRALIGRVPASSAALRGVAIAAITAAVCGPAVVGSIENHPLGPSYYNEFAGSYRGAADLGMFRTFWGYQSRDALPWINANAPERGRVWTQNTTGGAWTMYKRDDLLRKDLRATGAAASQLALQHEQKAFVYRQIEVWEHYGTRAPKHVVHRDGVPYLSVYLKPGTKLLNSATAQ